MKAVEDMDVAEVILGEEIFEEDVIFKVDIIIEQIENRRLWRQPRSRERERRSRLPYSSRLGSKTSTNRDRIRCFRCREYDHFANEWHNLIPDNSDRDSDSARSVSLYLADSDTGLDMDHYLNI